MQHVSEGGFLLFEWSPFDHFAITNLPSASRSGEAVNWTHGNAIDLDASGTLVVSFRSLNELTGIDSRTGEVLWRTGGSRNEFTFVNSSMPPFARQHGLRLNGPRSFTLLDNAGRPDASHAEQFDVVTRIATLVRSYDPLMPVVATLGGTTQELPGGHLLVFFGTAGRVEEFDAAGNRVWQMEGNAGYVFRAQCIRSLYPPWRGRTVEAARSLDAAHSADRGLRVNHRSLEDRGVTANRIPAENTRPAPGS